MRRASFLLLCAFAVSTASFADEEALRRSLSSKQTMLRRFQNEYQAAASAPERAEDVARLKKKMDLLKIEIVTIEKQFASSATAPATAVEAAPTPPVAVPIAPAMPEVPAAPVPAAPASPNQRSFDELKGSEWPWLKPADKERFVSTAIGGLERNGIMVMGTTEDYIQKVDAILKEEPAFEEEYLADLVVFSVYDAEPHTREAIHKLRDPDALP